MGQKPSVVFMGTPSFALPALQALWETNYFLKAIYTQPPRPKGRGHHLQKSPIHLFAESKNIPVFTPLRLKEEVDHLKTLAPDLIVVVAYGLLLPSAVLQIPSHGCLNIHASLLPRWRGAAPIQHAILEGDSITGVTLMQMEAGMDTGPMIAHVTCPIGANTTTASLTHELSHLGAHLLIEMLPSYLSGHLPPQPQPTEGICLAPKIKASQGCLQWEQPADLLERQIRAFDPYPGAWFIAHEKRFKVHAARVEVLPCHAKEALPGTLLDEKMLIACGSASALRLLTLTPEGKKTMPAEACVKGYTFLRAKQNISVN